MNTYTPDALYPKFFLKMLYPYIRTCIVSILVSVTLHHSMPHSRKITLIKLTQQRTAFHKHGH